MNRQGLLHSFRAFPAVLFLLLLLPTELGAQTTYTTALSPDPLQNLGHSPRAYALGQAFTAVPGDPECLFYNPAGLDGVSSPKISLIHQDWIADISQETLLAAVPAGKAGAFALGMNYLDFGTLTGYDTSGNASSSLHPFRVSLSFGWGGPCFPGVSLGLAGHGLVQSLSTAAANLASSLQLGCLWAPFSNLHLGGSYSFLNTDASTPDLGFLKLGASWSYPVFFKEPALLEGDFSLPLYNVARLQFGVEQTFLEMFAVRLGYQWEIDNNYIAGFRGLSGGLGLDLHDFSLDYSYSPDGDLGFSQIIGLTYRLPGEPPKTAPTPNLVPPEKTQVSAPTPILVRTLPPTPLPVSSPTLTPVPSPALVPNPVPAPLSSPTAVPSTNPFLNFNPSATVLPSDRVVKVETRFQIPDTVNSPASASVSPSPEMEKNLGEAGQKVGQNPQDAQAWMALGNLYWQSGQPDYALQCFTEVLQLRPDTPALKDWLDRYWKAHPGSTPGE